MSTLSSQSSPSPTPGNAALSFIAVMIFPLLCFIWMVKCLDFKKGQAVGFFILGIIGGLELFVCYDAIFGDLSWKWLVGAVCVYAITWFITLMYLAPIKNDFEKSTA